MSDRAHDENPIRAFRARAGMSLDGLAAEIERVTGERPSRAKLSRIERDQMVPLEMVPALKQITGLPGAVLRPDLVSILSDEVSK